MLGKPRLQEAVRGKNKTASDLVGLLSCGEWTGVAVKTVLQEVGLKDDAKWVIAEGADAAALTRSIPIEKCLDDAMLVYSQNGERLRPEQGYPLRLLVPGFEGNMNVKWLRRIHLSLRSRCIRARRRQNTPICWRTGKRVSSPFTWKQNRLLRVPPERRKDRKRDLTKSPASPGAATAKFSGSIFRPTMA